MHRRNVDTSECSVLNIFASFMHQHSLRLLAHKFVFEHRSLSEHNINTMKITLPLSFFLCLPAMAMAKESPPDADAVLLRAVDTEAGQRRLAKSAKAEKMYEPDRRLAKSVKAFKMYEPNRRRAAEKAKSAKADSA